jgi:thiamine-monophosphate kinase
MDSEDKLVERIGRAMSDFSASPGNIGHSRAILELGAGDDAAVIRPSGRKEWVLSCDAFLEGVHFLANRHPADSVGYKALARATSDLAAMGAAPRFFLLTLALPRSRTGAWLDGFLKGMNRAARTLGIRLIGGDTTRFSSVVASITVLGEVAHGEAITRAGARPGDTVYVSGRLGGAQLGLGLVRKGLARRKDLRKWLQPHLYPRIRIQLGAWLARNRIASSMMDLSDGLSTDLPRLCAASGVGAHLQSNNIPRLDITTIPLGSTRSLKLDPLKMALHGGEDYELLFTIPARHLKRLQKAPGFPTLAAIGIITADKSILLDEGDGKPRPLKSEGWDPFRSVK